MSSDLTTREETGGTDVAALQAELAGGPHTLREQVAAGVRRVRGGDLGLLPVVAGLAVIWIVFQSLDRTFLSSTNLINLSLDVVPVGVIALGIVCVLLVGEIDLSVGSVSGLSAALMGTVFVAQEQPVWLGLLTGIAAGCTVGLVYALVRNRFGVPSFVVTLAGLLGFLGLQLFVLSGRDGFNLGFDSGLVKFASLWFVPKWLSYALVLVAVAGVLAVGARRARTRAQSGLPAPDLKLLLLKAGLLLVLLLGVVAYLNQQRGVAWFFVFFIALVLALQYVLTRTKFGRSMYAVGGNAEAARRAGINVAGVYTAAFVMCSGLAALGGMLAAARLGAATQATGTGDVNLNAIAAAVIGGTSLFGGRGSALSALLGILVIGSISSGLTLLDLGSSFRFMITGAVLVLAVGLDSVARRSRSASGRG